MWFLWCDSFMFTFVLSGSVKLSFLLKNTMHYRQFCQFEHAWVYVQWTSPFFISIMHAHLKKNMSYVYVQRVYDQIINANAWIYGQWASPFSISIMHARPKRKHVLCYNRRALVCHKYLCSSPLGFNYDFFVNALPIEYNWK